MVPSKQYFVPIGSNVSIQVSNYEMDKWLASYFVIQAMARIQVGSYIEILGLAPCILH